MPRKHSNVVRARTQKRTKTHTQQLNEIDWALIDEVLRNPGITDRQLSAKLGYTRSQINRRRNRPRLQLEIAEFNRDAIVHTQRIIAKALRRAERILQYGNDRDAKTIALKFINGLLEIAKDVSKLNAGQREPTPEEVTALSELEKEIAGRKV